MATRAIYIEFARSNRIKCRMCGGVISKGDKKIICDLYRYSSEQSAHLKCFLNFMKRRYDSFLVHKRPSALIDWTMFTRVYD